MIINNEDTSNDEDTFSDENVSSDEDMSNDEVLQEINEILNKQPTNGETNLDDLLAIIAEINLDKKEILSKIQNVDESEGVALHAATESHGIGILVGEEIKVCVAKEDIEQYEIVKFVSLKENKELLVVPLKTYNKDILNLINDSNFAVESKQLPDNHQVTANAGTDLNTSQLALESGGNLDIIAEIDFATETTLSELNEKVESVTENNISKIQTTDKSSQNIFELILIELQKMNMQLSLITDNEIKENDI